VSIFLQYPAWSAKNDSDQNMLRQQREKNGVDYRRSYPMVTGEDSPPQSTFWEFEANSTALVTRELKMFGTEMTDQLRLRNSFSQFLLVIGLGESLLFFFSFSFLSSLFVSAAGSPHSPDSTSLLPFHRRSHTTYRQRERYRYNYLQAIYEDAQYETAFAC
jgi:hypothetical protein